MSNSDREQEARVPTRVTTEYVRRHYAKGPTAYRPDGSIVRMPTPEDVAYCERQFDGWLAAHDAALLAAHRPTEPDEDSVAELAKTYRPTPGDRDGMARARAALAEPDEDNWEYGVRHDDQIDVYPEDDARALYCEDPDFYQLVRWEPVTPRGEQS